MAQDAATRLKFLNDLNGLRQNYGLSPVCYNSRLNSFAVQHSNEMQTTGDYDHNNADGTTYAQRVDQSGIPFSNSFENIHDISGVQACFNGWVNSNLHLQNMLKPNVRYIGLGNVGNFWTLDLFESDGLSCDNTLSSTGTVNHPTNRPASVPSAVPIPSSGNQPSTISYSSIIDELGKIAGDQPSKSSYSSFVGDLGKVASLPSGASQLSLFKISTILLLLTFICYQ